MIRKVAFSVGILWLLTACGPVPKPADAYSVGNDILSDFQRKIESITSFRITGRVDHFGEEHRIQGKMYLFSVLPRRLRVELVSPFGSPLSVLTVNEKEFALHDAREGRYLTGPAEPCNIARLIQIPLPAEDVIRILVGHAPLIDGTSEVDWDSEGFYRVHITDGVRTEQLEIGPDKETLPLRRAVMTDAEGVIFDIAYDRHQMVGGHSIPHEIRVKMPREKADLLLRYDAAGVELNVELPTDAWSQTPPSGLLVEHVACESDAAIAPSMTSD